jgi:hypothetical protein
MTAVLAAASAIPVTGALGLLARKLMLQRHWRAKRTS